MRKRILVTVGLVVALGLLTVFGAGAVVSILIDLHILSAPDEAPIIVRNGSLEIVAGEAKDNKWTFEEEPDGDNENEDPSFSHEPVTRYGDRSKTHWVKLVQPSAKTFCSKGSPNAKGAIVRITYAYSGSQTKLVTIQRGASGKLHIDYRTKIRPTDLTPSTVPSTSGGRPALIFPVDGYISKIEVPDDNNWSCTFGNTDKPVLYVCSAAEKKDCQ